MKEVLLALISLVKWLVLCGAVFVAAYCGTKLAIEQEKKKEKEKRENTRVIWKK